MYQCEAMMRFELSPRSKMEQRLNNGFAQHYNFERLRRYKAKLHSKLNSAGFTLIETIVYICLVSFIVSSALITTYQILDSQSALKEKIEIEEEMNFLIRKLSWALSGLGTINQPAANTTSTILSINKINYSQNPLVFDLNSDNMRLKRGTAGAIILNSSTVALENLLFEHIAASSTRPAGIKVTMAMAFKPPPGQATTSSSSIETIIYSRK